MKLLTSEAQEDAVKRRVEKKATVFGQSITSDGPIETGVNNSLRLFINCMTNG